MRRRLRRMLFPAFVATRLVRSRRSRRLSTVTLVSIVAVSFGVMALTVVLGITSGFQHAFQQRILGLYPHVVVMPRGGDFHNYDEVLRQLRALPDVVGATPATYDDMMMASGVHRAGAVVKGVDPDTIGDVVTLDSLVQDGDLSALREQPRATVTEGQLSVEDAVAGSWLTVVTSKEGVSIFTDPPLSPAANRAEVSVLDLRGETGASEVRLQDAEVEPEATDREPDIVFRAEQLQAGRHPARHGAQGLWRLNVTDELIDLKADRHTTIVLFTDASGRDVSRLLSRRVMERARERKAMIRVVNLDSTRALTSTQLGLTSPLMWGDFVDYRPVPARLPGLILGKVLAERLNVRVGSEATLVTPLRGIDSSMLGRGHVLPSSTRFSVVGIFESGFYEYDVRLGLTSLETAQRFLNRGQAVRWIEVKGHDALRVDKLKHALTGSIDPFEFEQLISQTAGLDSKLERYFAGEVSQEKPKTGLDFLSVVGDAVALVGLLKYRASDFGYVPEYRLIDWQEMNANLFSALKLQKVVLTIFFLIIIIVGSFVVVGSQIMIIHEKTADIAILRAMGTSGISIRMIFTLQGLLVAGLGTAIGLGLGFGICALIEHVDYGLDASVYLIDRLPAQLALTDALVVAVSTALCTLAASQYSAAKAAAKTPAEGIRAVD